MFCLEEIMKPQRISANAADQSYKLDQKRPNKASEKEACYLASF